MTKKETTVTLELERSPLIGTSMSLQGRLRDEILTRIESLAAAGDIIAPKQIATDICSDTPSDQLSQMLLEVALPLISQMAVTITSGQAAFRRDGREHRGLKASDGSQVDIEKIDYAVRVPGYGRVPMSQLTPAHCAILGDHHKDLADRHTNLSKFWAAAGKSITAKKASVLGDVMDSKQLEDLWAKYARSGAESAV